MPSFPRPGVVERRKSHRQQGVRTRARTESGRSHAAGKENRSEDRAAVRFVGWNVIEPSAARKSTAGYGYRNSVPLSVRNPGRPGVTSDN